jgi:hypothetical protein
MMFKCARKKGEKYKRCKMNWSPKRRWDEEWEKGILI